MIPSIENEIGYISNQITSSKKSNLSHLPNESSSPKLGNFYFLKTVISCSASNTKFFNCCLIGYGANDHVCLFLHVFE